jgi:cold shock protein
MSTVGTVRFWLREDGWGVIDSPDTPGGCWAHCSHLWHEEIARDRGEVIDVSGGFREAFAGETVDFEWEPVANQDGYTFRANTVRPRGRLAPHRTIRRYRPDG